MMVWNPSQRCIWFIVLAGACASIAGIPIDARQTAVTQTRAVDLSKLPGPKILITPDAVRTVSADASKLAINPQQYVIARWSNTDVATPPLQSRDSQAVMAGYGFIGVTREGQEIRFRPIIETSGNLQVAADGSAFEGRVFVGLVDLRNPAASYQLPTPIALLIRGQVDTVAPQQLSMTHTNLPFEEVSIGARDPSEQIELHLLAAGTAERATVMVKVARPRLEIVPARSRIQGFGFERVEVNVRAIGLQRPSGWPVTLASEPGSFESTSISLNEHGAGVGTLRSVSIGEATVQAISAPLSPASTTVSFVWPVATLIASVLGGMVGALVKRMQRGRVRSMRALRPVLIVGILSGVVVVALYAVGVNVLPVQPTATAGEALTFVLAAVGGYLGLRLPESSAK